MLDTLVHLLDVRALATQVASYIPRLVAATVLLALFAVVAFVARRALGAVLTRTEMPDGTRRLLLRVARFAIAVLALVTVLDQLGVNVTSVVAGLGIAGLAVSFAAQDTIANIISGVTLLLDQPFRPGDWVQLGDLHATVTEVRLRTTVLTTFDNETLVVPNKALAAERIVNYTLTPRARVRVSVGVAYKESIDAARAVLLSTLTGDGRVLADPAPEVVVTGLGASSVDLQLRFWTEEPVQKLPLTWEYTEKAKKALDAAGIEIPFPHLQLFLEQTEALAAGRTGTQRVPR